MAALRRHRISLLLDADFTTERTEVDGRGCGTGVTHEGTCRAGAAGHALSGEVVLHRAADGMRFERDGSVRRHRDFDVAGIVDEGVVAAAAEIAVVIDAALAGVHVEVRAAHR